jgi:hypothetical protein
MDKENKKSPDRANGQGSRDGRTDIVPSRELKTKQPQLISIMRAMRYSQAIAAMGRDAYAIVCYVAERCDETFWRGPVPLFNGQLSDALGFGSWRSLERARAIAVESGWLSYEQKSAKLPGLYYVAIPAHCMSIRHVNERTYDETAYQSAVDPTYQSAVDPTAHVLPNTYNLEPKEEDTFFLSQNEEKQDKPKTSKTKKRPTEPNKPKSLDEVREYFAEAKLTHITPEEYYDSQEARGWTIGKDHRPVQNWKSNANQWDRQAAQRSPQPPQKPGEYKRSHDGTACPQPPKPMTGNRPPRNRDYSGVSQ